MGFLNRSTDFSPSCSEHLAWRLHQLQILVGHQGSWLQQWQAEWIIRLILVLQLWSGLSWILIVGGLCPPAAAATSAAAAAAAAAATTLCLRCVQVAILAVLRGLAILFHLSKDQRKRKWWQAGGQQQQLQLQQRKQ